MAALIFPYPFRRTLTTVNGGSGWFIEDEEAL
jgi:hypothetical protein